MVILFVFEIKLLNNTRKTLLWPFYVIILVVKFWFVIAGLSRWMEERHVTPTQPSVISQKHRSQKVQHYFSQAPVRALKSITGVGSLRACQRSNWTSDFFPSFLFLLVIKRVCSMLWVLPEYETWLIKRRTGRIILQNKETNISQQPVDWLLHSLED